MTTLNGPITSQMWGRPPVCRRWSLDVLGRTDCRVNPEGCQKVAGGRLGQGGTTTGRPRPRIPHPGGVQELPFPDCCNLQVQSILSRRGSGGSGTPPGCGTVPPNGPGGRRPTLPSATTGYLLATLRVGQSRTSKLQGQTGGPMPLAFGRPHPAGMNANSSALKRYIPVNNHGL